MEPKKTTESASPRNKTTKRGKTSRAKPKRRTSDVATEERDKIIQLYQRQHGLRTIATAMGCNRKLVRRILIEAGHDPQQRLLANANGPSKLEPFREAIRERVSQGLTLTRILRELRELGYTGGRTILGDYLRSLRSPLVPTKPVKRRFETAPGEESQVDWSVYTVPIAGRPCRVHGFACVLACCRKGFLQFYRNEQLPTLLEGLRSAFEYFQGVTLRTVFDNPTTVSLGRTGRERRPIWQPRLLELCRHYGTEPYACAPRYPDRKGEVEAFIGYAERDFVRGSKFASLEELNREAKRWCDEVANKRTHGTTGLVPDEQWLVERDFLIRLPESRFAVHRESVRRVGQDATLSIDGTLYTVPAHLALRSVAVRLYAEHFEVLDPNGAVAFSRRYVEPRDKGKLQIDPAHYQGLTRPVAGDGDGRRLDEQLLKRFPQLAALVAGIQKRMKTLAPIHLKALLRLAARYGEQAFTAAALRAQDYRRYDAQAVRRILEREHPLAHDDEPIAPVGADARARVVLGEVDAGSPDDYGHLDTDAGTDEASDDAADAPDEPPTNRDDDTSESEAEERSNDAAEE